MSSAHIESSAFHPLTGQTIALQLQDGSILSAVVERVRDEPQARNPYSQTEYMPFAVYLSVRQETAFNGGMCALTTAESRRLENIYISRVAPSGRNQDWAYYQICFT